MDILMTTHTQLPIGSKLDRRWFALFFLLQMGLLAAYLWLPPRPFFVALIGVGSSIMMVLLILYPWIIVPALVATTSLDIAGQLIETTALGIPLTGFHLSLALMFIALLANIFLRRRLEFPPFELAGPLALFLGMMAISLTYSPNQPEATIGFVRTFFLVVFLYGVQIMIDSKKAVTMVVVAMGLCIIASSILAVAQIFSEKFYLPASFVIAVGANAPRATGTFHNPNTFGTFLMIGVILFVGILVNYRMARWKQAILVIPIVFGLTGLITTFSRSNWLATLVGVLLILYLAKKLRYVFVTAIAGFLITLSIKEFVPFAEHIFERFLSIFTIFEQFGSLGRESSSARIFFVFAGVEMFLENPFLGVGWRAFPLLFDQYKAPDFPNWVPTKESHTLFANIMAELGIIGISAAIWIVGRTLRRCLKGLKTIRDEYLRAVLISLLAIFVAFQISLSLTADFENNFLWFFTGMIFAVARLGEKAETL
jgi:putative inorganic carbon (HCO3(-)) transporter